MAQFALKVAEFRNLYLKNVKILLSAWKILNWVTEHVLENCLGHVLDDTDHI